MRDWFADAFGAAVADIRAKLIDEAWFDRRVPEPQTRSDPGWSCDHPSASGPNVLDRVLHDTLDPDTIGERGVLDRLGAEHFADRAPEAPEPEHDRGIDR